MLWGENRKKWKKAGSHWESNPGHLWLVPPVLCHWAMATGQPPALTCHVQAVSDLFWSTETLCRTCFGHYPTSWLLALYLLSLCVHVLHVWLKRDGFSVWFYFESRVWHLHKWEAGIWRYFDCLKCILFPVSSFLPEGNWTILLKCR